MGYRMRKAFLVTSLLAALASGTIFYNVRTTQPTAPLALGRQPQARTQGATTSAGSPAPTTGASSGRSANPAGSAASGSSASTPAPVPETQASYRTKNGSFTGQRVYAYYGYVQVRAVVQNGKLQKVNVLEHPNDNGTSRYINSVAMPYLIQEAVQAQNANVSLISGATLSSEAFVKSLSTALAQAGA